MNNTTRTLTLASFAVLIAFNYIQCSPKHERPRVTDTRVDVGVKKIEDQATSFTDVVNSSDSEQKAELKELFVEKVFRKVIQESFVDFKSKNSSYERLFESLEEVGVEPVLESTEINEKYIFGDKSINGLRYFTARYEDFGETPKFFSFELEPLDGAFEYAVELVKEYYIGVEEPCFTSVDNSTAFRDEDGEHTIAIYEITEDNIDLDSMNPPRTLEDVGSVIISIEKADGHHADQCGDLDIEEDYGSDHSESHNEG